MMTDNCRARYGLQDYLEGLVDYDWPLVGESLRPTGLDELQVFA
jgi:hypothetical protein